MILKGQIQGQSNFGTPMFETRVKAYHVVLLVLDTNISLKSESSVRITPLDLTLHDLEGQIQSHPHLNPYQKE